MPTLRLYPSLLRARTKACHFGTLPASRTKSGVRSVTYYTLLQSMAVVPSEPVPFANKELVSLVKENPVSGWDDAWCGMRISRTRAMD